MEEIIRLTGKEAEEFRRYREEKERKAMREQNRDAYKQLVDETIREVFPTLQVVSNGLAKYLTKWHLVAYDSIEEGVSASFAEALRRCRMDEVKASRFIVLNNEDIKDIEYRLSKRKSPKIVIIDSIQFLGLNTETYLRWKKRFSEKLFIYVTHLAGNYPEGRTALKIWRDSDVVIKVEGFRAYPTSRYGGGKTITVSEEKAAMFEITNH